MFKKFHQFFMPEFKITIKETTTLFEYLCDQQMLGKSKVVEVILPLLGVQNEKNLVMFDQEDKDMIKDFRLTKK